MARQRADTDVFHAIADPTRRRMLEMLRDEQIPATQLARAFRISQPSVSQHLRVLRGAGLVRARRIGRSRVYQIRPRQLRMVVDWVAYFDKFWDEKLDALGKYLKRKHPK
ncbi:MAG: winged helix-turn-helix transcriptional regulator [Anaerolineae bacterium]|nr:winged helix-turn-helix transcriptional regulator [Phycisphaerae bacterium]